MSQDDSFKQQRQAPQIPLSTGLNGYQSALHSRKQNKTNFQNIQGRPRIDRAGTTYGAHNNIVSSSHAILSQLSREKQKLTKGHQGQNNNLLSFASSKSGWSGFQGYMTSRGGPQLGSRRNATYRNGRARRSAVVMMAQATDTMEPIDVEAYTVDPSPMRGSGLMVQRQDQDNVDEASDNLTLQEALDKVRAALEKTREVANDPDAILSERKLPKAGNKKMPFENEEYKQSVIDARIRVKKSYRDEKSEIGEYLPLTYDPELIRKFYDNKPLQQIARFFEIGVKGFPLIAQCLADKIAQTPFEEVEIERAIQLRDLLVSLGPTFIKVGQALSIRPDIMPRNVMYELQKLCDDVPRFPNELAQQIFKEEMGKTMDEVFSEYSAMPVAAASIGQVYRGVLKDTGEEVAIKIQRPQILETVSLDLCLLRKLAYALQGTDVIRSDLPSILDEWAGRFYDEMNYVKEGENGLKFMRLMAPLEEITAPKPIFKHSSRKVLTMQWMEGKRLIDSGDEEINRLVNIGITCYLMQLLETGFFHADPHPGNMLRTEDGKLCILDFGLMSDLQEYQKYGMIGAIAHLVKQDYYKVAEDFDYLGFLPEDRPPLDTYVPTFTAIFDQALAGGGAKSIKFADLANDLAQVTYSLPFRLPPFFALVIRAIAVLEGIALQGDPEFAIIDEAYPYIAKRLLTDDSPYMKQTLNNMIFDKSGNLDMDQMIDLLENFETFAKINQAKVKNDLMNLTREEVTNVAKNKSSINTTREAVIFFFSEDGNYLRGLLEDVIVDGIDSMSKQAIVILLERLGLFDQISPLVPNAKKYSELQMVNISADDKKRIDAIIKIWEFLGPSPQNLGGGQSTLQNYLKPENILNISTEFGPYVQIIYPQMIDYFQRIFGKLYGRGRQRLADDLGIDINLVPNLPQPGQVQQRTQNRLPRFIPNFGA